MFRSYGIVSLSLMKNLKINKTEAAHSHCNLCFLRTSPFSQITLEKMFKEIVLLTLYTGQV